MKIFTLFCISFALFVMPDQLKAQDIWTGYGHLFQPVRNYVAYQSVHPVVIDGKGDEFSWEQAAWIVDFEDIEGPQKPKPLHPTKVKMLWDSRCLYVLAELEEPHIWAYYDQHDQIVYHENDFEVFIDPDGDTHNYFEFELNAANTLFDLFLPKPYRNGGHPQISWNASGFKSAVSLTGTLNNPGDTDKKWTLEMAIPFESLRTEGLAPVVPQDGQVWKINFSRVEWQTTVVNGRYQKKKDEKTGRFLSEYNWVWNPTGEINMHTPERWGLLQFSAFPVSGKKVGFRMPADEELKKILWLIYYKQMDFRKAHGHFAENLTNLSVPENLSAESGRAVRLSLSVNGNQFSAQITANDGQAFSVNETGLVQTINSKKTNQ